MTASYLDAIRPRTLDETTTHQGGVAHAVDRWTRLNRWLILGSAGGSYYVAERELTLENIDVVRECLDEDGARTVATIVAISQAGRAPKNDPAILALALASLHSHTVTRQEAFAALPLVCRTGTHILHFAAYRKALSGGRGMGRAMSRAIGRWFAAQSPRDLAYQAVKYPSRGGWALRDLLRLAREPRSTGEMDAVLQYIVHGTLPDEVACPGEACDFLRSVERVRQIVFEGDEIADHDRSAVALIRARCIPREALPTQLLNAPAVWNALLTNMPMTAMIRNLGKMTEVGLIAHSSDAERRIVDALGNADRLRAARVHPLSLLVALKIYQQGRGEKGSLTWNPSKRVVNALDEAFYLSFGAVEATGKRVCLSLDVSASMTWSTIAGMWITPREAAAALALVTMAVEPRAQIRAFSDRMVPLDIRPSMRLDEVRRIVESVPAGGTYCDLPMRQALAAGEDFDAFVTLTDNEHGSDMPVWEALARYRQARIKGARHAVVGMVSNGFSVADPDDPRQLDLVGFDLSTPQILSEFIAGRI